MHPLRDVLLGDGIESLIIEFTTFRWQLIKISSISSFFIYTLGAYLVVYITYNKKPLSVPIIGLMLVAVLGAMFRYIIEEMLYLHFFGFHNYSEGYTYRAYLGDNLYYGFLYMILGVGVYFIDYSTYMESQKKELEIQNRTTELAFLRSQVNPHFLFNTLNNLYSLVYSKSDNALKVLEKLSGLLRYSLYETDSTVPLAQEVKYLYDFIELERMRYNFPLALELNIIENLNDKSIAPFLFVPFVENAFKHGDLRNPVHPLEISLQEEGAFLVFKTYNLIQQKNKDRVGGIGMENVRKRLELLYPNDYTLTINSTETTFSVILKIPYR